MFGEEPIVGEKSIKVDKQKRIVIPSFTGVETSDQLVPHFRFCDNDQILFLYKDDEFFRISQKFMDFLEEQVQLKKMTPQQRTMLQRRYYGLNSFMPEKVDIQKRITLPLQVITRLELMDTVFTIGNETHLELCKDEETYHRILNDRARRM